MRRFSQPTRKVKSLCEGQNTSMAGPRKILNPLEHQGEQRSNFICKCVQKKKKQRTKSVTTSHFLCEIREGDTEKWNMPGDEADRFHC